MDLELELIEGGNYLAVEVNGKTRRILRAKHDEFLKFHSLTQAREQLAHNNYASITVLERNTYDEMCGEDVVQATNTTQLDWS